MVFLATTACEEFWDVSKPIVFLGEWCLLYRRRAYWGALNGKLMSSPYENAEAAEVAHARINNLYEKILPLLGESLNTIHGQKHGIRYWRIVVGPWLKVYLSAVYDRFVHIRHALTLYPACSTIGLSENSFMVPTDTLDFVCASSDDSYNLQLFTKILRALSINFPRKELIMSGNGLYGKLKSYGEPWPRRIINAVASLYAAVSARMFDTVLVRSSYFPGQFTLRLAARNIGHILPSLSRMTLSTSSEVDWKLRNQLKSIDIGEGDFERCLSSMLFEDIPQCFVEEFKATEGAAQRGYPKRTTAIFSANGWYYDETFKQWAGSSAEKGTIILGTQHGGNYGALTYMPSEDHETAIVDRYYTWGWTRTDCAAAIVPMPATKLLQVKKLGADNEKHGILWAATSVPRYLTQYPFLPADFREYLEWQIRFATALPGQILNEVKLRPHYVDHQWDILERIEDRIPALHVESWGRPFQNSLEDCRLYVCDHLSTTFAEALAANKPTVLFWNPETIKIRSEAQPNFDLLREYGILFDTAEDAASAVASVYGDVEEWWNAPARQKAIEEFCRRHARTSPDAFKLWSRELQGVISRSRAS
jgi:putative transferase (TIGR04331 family)